MAKSKKSRRRQGRFGRPPQDRAGDVEARILDAAQRVFLQKGYSGASIDEIAERGPASKPTIYSHFPGKEALFTAVVVHVINSLRGLEGYTPGGRTMQEKLTNLGTELVERFIRDTLRVTRVAIAEADRVPELSRRVREGVRDRTVDAVSRLLNDAPHAVSRMSRGTLHSKGRKATAQIFMDLILLPKLMQSLMGYDAKLHRTDLSSFIRERVNFFGGL